MIGRHRVHLSRVVLFLSVCFFSTSAEAEEQTVKALATWQAQGLISQVGPGQALFVGSLMGAMFTEGGQGSLDASSLLCPGTVEINMSTGARKGGGKCIITDMAGDKVYATWSCNGNEKGCKGPFQLTGGTGKFQGISGDNSVVIRIALRGLVGQVSDDSFQQVAAGLAIWPKFHYKIP